MAKKQFVSSAHAKLRARNAKPIPDSRLDLSDIPESTDEELRRLPASEKPAITSRQTSANPWTKPSRASFGSMRDFLIMADRITIDSQIQAIFESAFNSFATVTQPARRDNGG